VPEFRAELVEIKGIGMATAKKIEEVYPNREALVGALVGDSFVVQGISDEVLEKLKEAFMPQALPEIPEMPDVEINVYIRSCWRQPMTINYRAGGKAKSLFISTRWTRIPKDHLDVLDSPHFNDLALLGRVEVKA